MSWFDVIGLKKAFGDKAILKGIDLSVTRGECLFLIGPSGSGKSTLLRCLNRLEEPSGGSIRFARTEITAPACDLNRMRQKIGMVFQAFNLYPHLNALENVALALRLVQGLTRKEAARQAMDALAGVNLAEKATAFPSELSGGQQQRVAIARALALKPEIMLFDEPTSALDPELVGSVIRVMQDLRRAGMTMIVVSHEMRFARQAADRVVFMLDGEIVETGTPAEVFDAPRHPRLCNFLQSLHET